MRRLAAVVGMVAVASACQGRQVPCVTAEVPINTGLTFVIGGNPSCRPGAGEGCANSPGNQGDRTIPEHTVRLAPYLMDQTEVTNVQYRHCVDMGVCNPPTDCVPISSFLPLGYRCAYDNPENDDVPVVAVTWEDARKYCQWVGKDLPSEAQWERAAVGPRDVGDPARKFPWGDETVTASRAHIVEGDSCLQQILQDLPAGVRSDARKAGQSAEGIYDLSGNVREWVLDDFDQTRYCAGTTDGGRPGGVNDCSPLTSGNLECVRTDESAKGLVHDRAPEDALGGRQIKVVRGGAFCATATSAVEHDCDLHTRSRSGLHQGFQENGVPGPLAGFFDEAQVTGFRCARLATAPAPTDREVCPLLPLEPKSYQGNRPDGGAPDASMQ